MKLACRDSGGAGPVLVILHGFLGSAADWGPTMAALPGFRCVAVDLPGHGASAPATSLDDFIADFDALLAELGIARFGLLGYSMGGRLGLHVACRKPDRVQFLALVSASPGLEDAVVRRERLASDAHLAYELERDGLPRFLARWYAQPLFASLSPELRAALIARRSLGSAADVAGALRAFRPGALASRWDDLPHLAMPVLALTGERDAKYVAIGRRVADLCPHGVHRTVADAGHAIHEERPAEFVGALRAFFQSLENGAQKVPIIGRTGELSG